MIYLLALNDLDKQLLTKQNGRELVERDNGDCTTPQIATTTSAPSSSFGLTV